MRSRLPLTIWALGLGSLLTDTSSELIHSLSPVLLVNVLGASVVSVGLIEGFAEATASVTRVFAVAISDYFHRRKRLIVFGYSLGALTRPLFPLAQSAHVIFVARFLDRMSKASRDAPRDALRLALSIVIVKGGAIIGPSRFLTHLWNVFARPLAGCRRTARSTHWARGFRAARADSHSSSE